MNKNLNKQNIIEIIHDNKFLKNSLEICNAMNHYFSTCVVENQNIPLRYSTHFLSQNTPTSFFLSDIEDMEIITCVKNMKNSHSCGHDDISSFIIKNTISAIIQPLNHIFNLSFKSGIFPDHFKISKIIPLLKDGDPKLASNYRPISLLPSISKILERLMFKRLSNYLDSLKFFNESQYGFRRNRSTELALLDITEFVLNGMENKLTTVGVFLDLSKAFDSVNHDILLKKLNSIGIRGLQYNWFESYLKCRHQYVSIGSNTSAYTPIKCGVPQGSILSPLLFLIFMNDISNVSKIIRTVLFADDTTFLCSGKNIKEVTNTINSKLIKIYDWLASNSLNINYKKTNYMLFGPKIVTNTLNTKIFINNTPLERVPITKFLGFMLCDNLSWLDHILYTSTKITKLTGILFKLRYKLTADIVKKIYYSLIYPYLTYGIIIWGNSAKSHLDHLNLAYNYFIRCLFVLKKSEHITEFYKKGNLLKISQIYRLYSSKFMYKVNQKIMPQFVQNNFQKNTHRYLDLRFNRDFKTPLTRLQIFKSSIFCEGVSIWNDLNKELKLINNIKLFMKLLKDLIFNESIELK